MGDWWLLTAEAVGLLVLAVVVPVVWIIVRRRWLATSGQVFDCALRPADAPEGAGWMLGAARYRGEVFEWYRTFSLSWRPRVVLPRADTTVRHVREPDATEAMALYEGQVIAVLDAPHTGLELAMGRDEMTAFHSWTEAAPPGQPPS